MALTTMTVIGAAAYISKRSADKRKSKTLMELFQPETGGQATHGWGLPLRVKSERPPTVKMVEAEAPNRHHLALSAGMLGITAVGKLTSPVLAWATVPVLLYLNLPFLAAARQEVMEKRAGIGVLDAAASLGMLALGDFFADALFLSLYFLSDRLLDQTRQSLTAQDDLSADAPAILPQTYQSERTVNAGSLPMLALGALTWPLLGAHQAVAVLVNYFGFDLRVVAPLSVLRHLREAADQGIQISDGRLLETLHNEELVFVFDAATTARSDAQATISALINRGVDVVQLSPHPTIAQTQILDDPRLADRPICFVGTELDAPAARQAGVIVTWGTASQGGKAAANRVVIQDDLTQLADLLDLAAAMKRNIRASYVITALPAVVSLAGIFFLNFGVVTAILLNYTGLGLGVFYALIPSDAPRFSLPKTKRVAP